MNVEKVALVGDTHSGSVVGLWPLDDLPLKGEKWVGIRYLMSQWNQFIKDVGQIDILAILGDVIDGPQRKSDFKGIITTDMGEQAEGASKVWEPLVAKAKKVIRVEGTPYHETHDDAPLALFDKNVGVHHSAQVINLDLDGKILNIAHHPSGGHTLYKGTAAHRELMWSILAAYDGYPDITWLARGHQHCYLDLSDGRRRGIFNPCWQLQTKHAVKGNLFKWQPDLGAVVMYRNKNSWNGWDFKPYIYPRPKVPILRF